MTALDRHDHASHPHSDHVHTVTSETDTRRLATALALIVAFMAAEAVAGILAHSLALLSDAALWGKENRFGQDRLCW